MDNVLKKQVERIIDEGVGPSRSVIVQMKSDETTTKKLLDTAGEAIHRRRLSTTARDMLPPKASALTVPESTKRTRVQRRELLEEPMSMTSQFALAAAAAITMPVLMSTGLAFLKPLIESDFVKDSIRRAMKELKKGKPAPPTIPHFWSSSSAVLKLDKEDLWKLLENVSQIADIYPNRTLRVPPVAEVGADSLPQNVQENKVSAWGIHATGALTTWGAYGIRGKGVKIAVLDTGVDPEHPNLKGKIASDDWAEFDDQGNMVADSEPGDSGQHGTHCAGTIVGGNEGGHWIGMAPEAKLAVGLVLKNGVGTDAQILAGLQWAIERGVDAINMSLGGLRFGPDVVDTYTRMFINANRLGIPVVVSIGNEGSQTSGSPGNDYFAFSVGATDYRDRPAGFSGGRTQVIWESRYIDGKYLPLVYSKPDVSAPGVAIKSSIPGGKYAVWNGTSMATPHVAGSIALLLSGTDIRQRVAPHERAYVIQDLLIGSVEEMGESGQDHRFGFGRIDVLRAIGFAKERGY